MELFPTILILVTLAWVLVSYIWLSRLEGTFANVLFPSLLIGVPAYFLLPLVHIFFFGIDATLGSYLYVYGAITTQLILFVIAYVGTGSLYITLPFAAGGKDRLGLAALILLVGWLVYLPVLVAFSRLLWDPRQLYTATRYGYGVEGFLSSALAYLSLVVILFEERRLYAKWTVIACIGLLLVLHGSKGQLVGGVFIWLLYEVYGRGRRVGFWRTATWAGIASAVILVSFFLSGGAERSVSQALKALSSYADYTRNAALVIDSKVPLQHGRLTIENNTLALIPRVVWTEKPKDFGSLFLARSFFPERYEIGEGAPAFGVGVQYADFGKWAIFYIAMMAAFQGFMARIFVNRLRMRPHPSDLLMVAFFSGVSIIPTGLGWLMPETLFLALLVGLATSVRIRL